MLANVFPVLRGQGQGGWQLTWQDDLRTQHLSHTNIAITRSYINCCLSNLSSVCDVFYYYEILTPFYLRSMEKGWWFAVETHLPKMYSKECPNKSGNHLRNIITSGQNDQIG